MIPCAWVVCRVRKDAAQNPNRRPTRTSRSSMPSRPVFAVLVIVPKPLLLTLPFGFAKCGVFVTLKISTRI